MVAASVCCQSSDRAGGVATRGPVTTGLVAGGDHDDRHPAADADLDSAIPSLWFVATPFLSAAALTVSFTATDHLIAGCYAAAAGAGLTAVLIVAAVIKPRELSIPRRRWLDLFENTLLITILPAMLWLVGLVSLIRNRGAI